MPVEKRELLEFVPQRKIRWLRPGTLVRAALDVALSGTFGRFADKRELFAGVPQVAQGREPGSDSDAGGAESEPPLYFDYSEGSRWTPPRRGDDAGLWFDYVSDTGDGFEATYTIAWLLAKARLEIEGLGSGPKSLPGGDVVLLGGDQVYPAPSEQEYDNRFFGPFRAALPEPVRGRRRDLYAIPGNHDWYDGLTAFTRKFCNPGPFSGYYGRQTRSYWALRLPSEWWVWAIDVQLDTYIDNPQIEYFKRVGEHMQVKDRAKHKLILLTAKPSWVKPDLEPASWRNLRFFEQRVVPEDRARIVLVLTGDLHHYSRYESAALDPGPVRLTAGGGGAYMSPTHTLQPVTHPKLLPAYGRPDSEGMQFTCMRRATYPTIEQSRPMARHVFKLVVTSPSFCALLGAIYVLLGALGLAALDRGASGLVANATAGGFLDMLGEAASVGTVMVALALCVALTVYAEFREPDPGGGAPRTLWAAKLGVGVPHALAHVAIAAALIYVVANMYSSSVAGALVWLTALPLGFVGGYAAGSFLFALVLYVIHVTRDWRSPESANAVFASQGIIDYKNFLRLHLDATGGLRVYPLGIDRAHHDWEAVERPGAPAGVEPVGGQPAVRLVDEVICFGPSGERQP